MITIIIPFYNADNTLFNTVLNALNQLPSGSELLLVDDGSDDQSSINLKYLNTIAIEKNIILNQIILPENVGLLAARIAGTKAAQFSYVGFLDADDYIFNIDIKELEIIKSNNFDIAIYRFLYCDKQLNISHELVPPSNFSVETAFRKNLMSWNFTTMGLYRKDFYISCEKIFNFRYACVEEVYFKYLFSKANNIYKSKIEYYYVQNPTSISNRINTRSLSKIISYNALVQILKNEKFTSKDIFLASTCTLNIAVEQSRVITNSEEVCKNTLVNVHKKTIFDIFWKQNAWLDCFHFFSPWISFKNFIKFTILFIFYSRTQ